MKKPLITIVVAMNKDHVIGVDNQLPWHIPEDLKYFKKVTLGKPIIMGRKTFESIGRILPGRKNIVISRNKDFSHPDIWVYSSLQEAVMNNADYDEICVIGGGEIFAQAMQIADTIHITIVDIAVIGATTLFPEVDLSNWRIDQSEEIITADGIKCQFNKMSRIILNAIQ